MKIVALATASLLALGLTAGSAEAQGRPGGCLKYGLGGAVAGHFAGGHRLKGALAGCALGIYQRRQHERATREQAERNRTAERRRAPDLDRPRPQDRDRLDRTGDLGIDLGRSRPQEQAGPPIDRRRPQGEPARGSERGRTAERDRFEPGGSFSRGQFERRGPADEGQAAGRRPRWETDPEETGSFLQGNGAVY